MNKKKQFIKEFENTINSAEAKALSAYSLENPLTDAQLNRLRELKDKLLEG